MNLRKDNNGAALNAWKKLGPGLIEKPLRHIRSRVREKMRRGDQHAKHDYQDAWWAASIGNGDIVQRIARSMP